MWHAHMLQHIDVTSKFLVQYFIRTKDEVLGCFKLFYNEYIMYVKDKHRNVNMGVITIISDQGEFNIVSNGDSAISLHVHTRQNRMQ